MANTISAFLETLVASAGEYNAATVGQLSLIDSVYMDVSPEAVGRETKTITIYFPDLGAFSDIGTGPFVDEDINPNSVSLAFNAHPAKSFTVGDFEQWQTAVQIREKFLDPMYKRAAEFLNGQIAALITAGNFNVNATIAGGTAAEVTVGDIKRAWVALATQKVPLANPQDLRLALHQDVYANQMTDSAFTQESLVGALQAEAARQKAAMRQAFNFPMVWDQQAPKTSVAVTGTAAVTNGSAAVVGTGTNFSAGQVGKNLVFPDGSQYRIAAFTDSTHITLSANFAGATASGVTVTVANYSALAYHKYAIACGLRPMPEPDMNVVKYITVYVKGIPLRVMIGYNQRSAGYLVTCDFGYALGVIRPAFGQLITC